jgi:DNA-binding beta-propeller fold protein YncE
MFDLNTLAVIKQIHTGAAGLDGFMYDAASNKVLTIDHSRPPEMGTSVVIDPASGDVVAKFSTSGSAPEGGVGDGKGRIFINVEDKNAIDVIDTKTWKVVDTWSVAPCDGPTGIAMDRASDRIFVGCSATSMVVAPASGKVVARIPNGGGVDGIAWDAAQKLLYIPSGADGSVTVVHQDSPDKYTVVATVPTMRGARTITLDPRTHTAYVFTPEYGPAPAQGGPPPTGRGRGPRGPQIAAWLIEIRH